MSEMEMMRGTCKYCGQIVSVKAYDQTDADNKAADQCGCEDSKIAQKINHAKAQLKKIMGADREFSELEEPSKQSLRNILDSVLKKHISAATCVLDDSTIKIARNKDKIKIDRSTKVRKGIEI